VVKQATAKMKGRMNSLTIKTLETEKSTVTADD